MNNPLALQNDKKLLVTYRVESGCLGPEGIKHIDKFCQFAQVEFDNLDSEHIVWNIVHREDKTLPEIQFNILGKVMNRAQAEKYLTAIGQSFDEFESDLSDQLTNLIHQFMYS